jgi:ribosomal protein S18 acetylase RimI-like enzyme
MQEAEMSDATTLAWTIRAAQPDDVDAIAQVWHDGWREAHLGHLPAEIDEFRRLPDFRDRVSQGLATITVAVDDEGHVLGMVMVHDDEVEQVYVAARARGTAVAESLLSHGEQVISQRFDRAWLAVIEANPRARRFYARCGWRDLGPFDHEAPAGTGTITVRAHRYEKPLHRPDPAAAPECYPGRPAAPSSTRAREN